MDLRHPISIESADSADSLHLESTYSIDSMGSQQFRRLLNVSDLFGRKAEHTQGFLSTQRTRGGGLGSRPKKMYGERLGDAVEYHLMSPTPRR